MPAVDESRRLNALRELRILDTPPEAIFDRLAALAATTFNAPIALVSLVDTKRQWFKACVGLDVSETGRDVAFCDHAIRADDVLIVPDASADARFRDNPLVTGEPGIRFYAGAPLITARGDRLGTLCVIDRAPRAEFGAAERAQLAAMAAAVIEAIQMRRDISAHQDLERERDHQKQLLAQAEEIAGVGHWSWDAATDTTAWSPAVYAIHGCDPALPPPDLQGVLSLYEPDDAAQLMRLVERALQTGEPYDLHAQIRRPDGETRHVSARGACVRDPTGAVVSLFGTFIDVTDLKLADERLRSNEARLQFLTEHSADVIMRVEPGKGITWISPSCRRLGYEPDDLVGLKANALIHPEDLPKVEAFRAARFAGLPDPPEMERQIRVRRSDGEWVWVEGNPTIIRDADGAPVEIVNVLRDITQRKEMEQQLAASEARYRLLAENATDVIACYGADGVFTYLSPAVHGLLGYAAAELVGRTPMEIMHPEDVGPVLAKFRAYIGAGQSAAPIRYEYRAFRKDGSLVWLEAQPRAIYAETGELLEFQDSVRDISERKAAEAALAESEMRHSVIAEYATDVIARSDVEGRLLFASPSVAEVTGYQAAELMANAPAFIDCVHPDDRPQSLAHVRRILAGETVKDSRLSYRFRRKDGEWIWLECNPTLVRDATGAGVELVDVLRDISAQRRIEADLRVARDAAEAAARVKADFMANMSHEIRTPLTAILGFSRLLAGRTDLDPEAATHLARISSAGQALLSIVNDVLDFSKLEAGQFEVAPRPASPTELLGESLLMFSPQAEAKGLTLELALDDLPPAVQIDPDRLRQVLLNLIGNAVKFTDAGGVRLTARHDAGEQRLHVAVEDTGAGMTEDQQQKLFQRFSQVDGSSTRQHGGTGLGLAICRGLTEAMGGAIHVRSEVGSGSTFYFDIAAPLAAMAGLAPEAAADEPPSLAGVRVLAVDDNPANRELVRAVLESLGAEVFVADNGAEGVLAASTQPVDVLLLDIRMPGLNGPDALRQIRTQAGPNQETPALAFTADADLDALYPGHVFDGVVAKPICPAALADTIRAVLPWMGGSSQERSHVA